MRETTAPGWGDASRRVETMGFCCLRAWICSVLGHRSNLVDAIGAEQLN